MLCVLCSAKAEYAYEIFAGQSTTVEISGGKSGIIKFCPTVSGIYRIESNSYYDLSGSVYDEEMTLLAFDDDSGDASNFAIEMHFLQDNNYYILVKACVDGLINADISVCVVETDSSHTHKYKEYYVRYPTCTQDGEKAFSCICGSVYTEPLKKKEHSFSKKTVSPTCTANGSEKITCKICGEEKTTAIAALGHSYSSKFTTDKAPTCTARGSKSKHCTRCDKKTQVTEIPSKGHSYSSKWVIDTKSSLSAAGKKSHHCSACNAKSEVTTIPKISSAVLSKTQYVYNGEDKKPSVTVKDSKGKTLKSGTDYEVSFAKDLKGIGSHSIFLKFKGNYGGSKTLTYKILPDSVTALSAKTTGTTASLSWKAVKGAKGYRVYKYIESKKEYIKLCDVSKTSAEIKGLKTGTYYIFAVRALRKVDSKEYLSASYSSVKTATIPEKTKLQLKTDERQAVLSWKTVNSSGYEIFMSQSKNGSYSKVKTIKGGNVAGYAKSNLSSGKTYYFKIRAVRKVGDIAFYGPYSDVVSVKIK